MTNQNDSLREQLQPQESMFNLEDADLENVVGGGWLSRLNPFSSSRKPSVQTGAPATQTGAPPRFKIKVDGPDGQTSGYVYGDNLRANQIGSGGSVNITDPSRIKPR